MKFLGPGYLLVGLVQFGTNLCIISPFILQIRKLETIEVVTA